MPAHYTALRQQCGLLWLEVQVERAKTASAYQADTILLSYVPAVPALVRLQLALQAPVVQLEQWVFSDSTWRSPLTNAANSWHLRIGHRLR